MAKRKTVAVADVLHAANLMLSATSSDMTAQREGVTALLERVLLDTDNYRGFQYTDGNNGGTDDTRRHYYG